MLKTIKRAVSLLLVAAMAVTAAACGSKGGDKTGGNTDKNKTQNNLDLAEYTLDSDAVLASMPEELKGTKITFLNWYNPDDREEKTVIDEFEEKTGIEVTYRVVDYGGYVDTVAGLLTVGETPDVLRMKSPDMGLLKLLQPISVTGYDFSDKAWSKATMDIYTFGDKCYGAALVNTPFFLPGMLFYNKNTVEEMGFENPYELYKQGKWTWDVFKQMCTEWVNQGTEYTGASLFPGAAVAITRGNADFVKKNADGNYELDLTNTEAIEAWKFTEECVVSGLLTNLNDGFDQAKQKLLFGSMDASAVQGSSSYFPKTRMRGQLEGVPHPKWADDSVEYYLPMMENIAFGVPKSAKNPKAVPYFLAYMCNFANYDQSIYDKDSNPTGFFFSEQIKECYMSLLTLPNRGYMESKTCFSFNNQMSDFGWQMYFKVDPSQINTFLQEHEYVFKDSTDLYNAETAKLK